MRSIILGAFLCLGIGLSGTAVKGEIMGDYLGYTSCMPCHNEIVSGWQTTPHANAFETLKEQGEEKQDIAGCVQCHVVAFEKDGGYIDRALTPELKDVQCEACHGPGRRHVESDGDPSEILVRVDENLCRSCHTEGQDKNFDYAVKSRLVHGRESKPDEQAAAEDKGGGWLKANVMNIAFGNMVEGVAAQKKVQLKNTGTAPLKIANVTTSCACTTTALGRHELSPGQTTELTIVYNTYKFPGKFEKYVTVVTDADPQEELVIGLHGFVKAVPMGILTVEPRKIELGGVAVGVATTGTITVKNDGDATMTVNRVASKKYETVYFDGSLAIPAGKTETIPFSVMAPKAGRYLDYVMIYSPDARNVTSEGYKVVITADAHMQ